MQNIAIIGAAVVIVTGLIGWAGKSWWDEKQLINALDGGACDFDTRSDPGVTNQHSDNPTFTVDPPSGGVHLPTNARAGDYSTGTVPPDGQIVHSNEHGYVTLWFRPGDEKALEVARQIRANHLNDTLIVPRSTLPTPIAATAWGKRLLCTSPDAERLEKFTDFYIGKGPEKVPRG